MEISELCTIISTVGFPIVAFGVCGYFLKYIFDENNKIVNSTLTKLTDAINSLENTILKNLKGEK